jgi:hypothetical protein
MSDREEAHRLLDAVFDHLEREAAEDSDVKRNAQQKAALSVINNFLNCAGWRDLLQRRLVTFIHGKPEGSASEAGELKSLVKTTRNFRRAEAKLLHDLDLLPASLKTIWSLIAAEDGRHGDHGGGGIYERDSVAGVDPDGGPLERLKITFVEKIGYTAGTMGLSETHRLSGTLLIRAQRAWRGYTSKETGKRPNPITSETIRSWCTRSGRLADVFTEAYERGRRDKRANRIDRSKLLPD